MSLTTTPNPPLKPGDRLIRRVEVERLTGLRRSAIYWRIHNDADWPRPVRVGGAAVRWLESEVLAWIQRRVAESRAEAA